MVKLVDKYPPREYTALSSSGGIVLCDKEEGSFLVLRYKEDLERLKALLEAIEIIEVHDD